MGRRRRRPADLVSFGLSFKVVRRTKSATPKDRAVGNKAGSLPNVHVSVDRIPLSDLLPGASTARAYFERRGGDDNRPRPSASRRQPPVRYLRSNSAMPALVHDSFPPTKPIAIANGQPIASTSRLPTANANPEPAAVCKPEPPAGPPVSKYVGKIDLRTVFQARCEKVVARDPTDCCHVDRID